MDVITLGESMVVFSSPRNESIVQSTSASISIAGAESNVATALARLGHNVKWLSRIGNDPFGEKIMHDLNAEGINTEDVVIDEKSPTGLMYKQKKGMLETEVLYYRNQSAARKMDSQNVNLTRIAEAKILHLTGITPSLSHSCKEMVLEAIEIAKKHNVLISFDPNIRLKLWALEDAKETLLPIIRKCDFFFPGREELKQLIGTDDLEETKTILSDWEVPVTVVKNGGEGAWILEEDTSQFIPAYQVNHVVDEVGAGDAFASGFLHGYLNKRNYETCVKLGHALAAFAVSTEGDTKGLPTKRELNLFWEKSGTTIR
ncbi:sugar kinase [Planococcus lenghuensis]|uniref:Carbohydrate kinase PfkB domain-containing protein n=1 Tax=Planococcus lenghuensis TaxID=2213202 RepID=A0A1Q2L5A5_9BACL|nr:sugar kinase [Planococcus lenghuensis]AQQ55609.1 hypothetical protein B0X71_20770 [Planococcus lenghuensis]